MYTRTLESSWLCSSMKSFTNNFCPSDDVRTLIMKGQSFKKVLYQLNNHVMIISVAKNYHKKQTTETNNPHIITNILCILKFIYLPLAHFFHVV